MSKNQTDTYLSSSQASKLQAKYSLVKKLLIIAVLIVVAETSLLVFILSKFHISAIAIF